MNILILSRLMPKSSKKSSTKSSKKPTKDSSKWSKASAENPFNKAHEQKSEQVKETITPLPMTRVRLRDGTFKETAPSTTSNNSKEDTTPLIGKA